MLRFKQYIFEADDKLRHLSHAEDRVIESGKKGFNQAFKVLHGLHKSLSGKKSDVKIGTKIDGAPSLVFGTHPETKKFFVASKSAWNKNPKINYTAQDIQTNHGHVPGLAGKLHQALKELPHVAPKSGVYQGDFLYSKGEVSDHGEKRRFTPNTLTYGINKNSPDGQKMNTSKMGIAVHTAYHGSSFADLKPTYLADLKGFNNHPNVHVVHPSHSGNADYTPARQDRVKKALGMAAMKHKEVDHDVIKGHSAHLQMYVNQTVRTNERPNVKGYYKFLTTRPEVKQNKFDEVKANQSHFKNVLAAHGYLELAKNALIHSLDKHHDMEHTIGGKPANPEGYVAVQKNVPTKIVKRRSDVHGPGFSQSNFSNDKFRK